MYFGNLATLRGAEFHIWASLSRLPRDFLPNPLFALANAREGTLADSEPRGSGTPWTGFMYSIGEQSHALRGSVNNRSSLRNFFTFNSRRSGHRRKFFNDENLQYAGFLFMEEPRKGGEIPRLHYAISRMCKFQDCMERRQLRSEALGLIPSGYPCIFSLRLFLS